MSVDAWGWAWGDAWGLAWGGDAAPPEPDDYGRRPKMILLSEDLPLRSSAELGDYVDAVPLAHVYGDLRASAWPLTQISKTEFHASEGKVTIDAVLIDGQDSPGWAQFYAEGYTGVRLAAPLPEGSTAAVRGAGKRNPETGALIEHPSDVIADLFRGAKRPIPTAALEAFRAQCGAGLRVAGVINQRRSIRAQIDEIVASVGAIWTASTTAFAVYPTAAPAAPLVTLDARNSSLPTLARDAADTAGALTLAYAQDWAQNRPARSITCAARGGQYRDTLTASLAATWLRQPRDAETVARRVLERLAGNALTVTLSAAIPGDELGGLDALRPGRWVQLDHVHARGSMFILGWQWAPGARSVQLTGELAPTVTPLIEITGRSAAVVESDSGGVEVAYKNGIATFTILDPDGKPLPGAQVSLDGGFAKIADARGQVRFEASTGKHRLAVAAKGFLPFEIEVEL